MNECLVFVEQSKFLDSMLDYDDSHSGLFSHFPWIGFLTSSTK